MRKCAQTLALPAKKSVESAAGFRAKGKEALRNACATLHGIALWRSRHFEGLGDWKNVSEQAFDVGVQTRKIALQLAPGWRGQHQSILNGQNERQALANLRGASIGQRLKYHCDFAAQIVARASIQQPFAIHEDSQ